MSCNIRSKEHLQGLIILIVAILSGILLSTSLVFSVNHLTRPPIQIISLNEEALFKEQSLKLAQLNLDEKSLQKQLSDFKKAFRDALKNLPKHFVVLRSHVLLRTDNVQDLTETFRTFLIESQNKGVKK